MLNLAKLNQSELFDFISFVENDSIDQIKLDYDIDETKERVSSALEFIYHNYAFFNAYIVYDRLLVSIDRLETDLLGLKLDLLTNVRNLKENLSLVSDVEFNLFLFDKLQAVYKISNRIKHETNLLNQIKYNSNLNTNISKQELFEFEIEYSVKSKLMFVLLDKISNGSISQAALDELFSLGIHPCVVRQLINDYIEECDRLIVKDKVIPSTNSVFEFLDYSYNLLKDSYKVNLNKMNIVNLFGE